MSACFEGHLSASVPNVKGRDQEPQDIRRDQDSVCPADYDAIGARRTTKSDGGPVKQRQAYPRQSGDPNQGRGAVEDTSSRTKPMLTSVNTMGDPKMTISPPIPCSRLPTNHFGSGGKIPPQK